MSAAQQPVEWSIVAQNLPEHARNPIHTDAGAQDAGFPRALVAGVTTYAYLTHPLIVAWGEDWLTRGGGEMRFRRPVFDQDVLRCVPIVEDDAVSVQAITSEPEQPRAFFRAVRDGGAVQPLRDGEVLYILANIKKSQHLPLEIVLMSCFVDSLDSFGGSLFYSIPRRRMLIPR